MFNKRIIQKALISIWEPDNNIGWNSEDQSRIIAQLIYDIFGGEILKTHNRKGWHFYNRINGKRIDLTGSKTAKATGVKRLEDIPSSPEETYNYFEKEDYSSFFMSFIKAFEEIVGLKRQRSFTF